MSRLEHTLSRREILKLAAAGVGAGAPVGWFRQFARAALPAPAGSGARARSCILLWMGGGPSQTDTFDMKSGSGVAGEFRPISTNVPGIQICEHLPRLARQADKLALVRSMSTVEADHGRGSYYMQTGYRQVPGTYHPHIGSIISSEKGRADFDLPNFFWLGGPSAADGGFLGARNSLVHIPQVHDERSRNLENVGFPADPPVVRRRISLLDHLEEQFHQQQHGASVVADHRETYNAALRVMRSDRLRAFDVGHESEHVRSLYGNTPFGRGCLLARRLVEVGVPFVGLNFGDWDTHHDLWSRMRPLLEGLDQGMSALLTDLQARGLLDSTLVVWMGEFGRDPRINNGGAHAGREHYAQAWTSVLAGGGVGGGRVIGRTSADGREVVERPVSTGDFMATLCHAFGIDYTKENRTPDGRPIRLAATGARPLTELFA